MIRATPTYFVTNPSSPELKSLRESIIGRHTNFDKIDQECIICCDKPADCVVFSCMHSGGCRDCTINELKRTQKCMICREKMTKLVIIRKVSEHEYRVIEEIIPSNAGTSAMKNSLQLLNP